MELKDIIDAIEKNGYKKSKGNYIQMKDGSTPFAYLPEDLTAVVSACAMGQAALNLGITPNELIKTLYKEPEFQVKKYHTCATKMSSYLSLPAFIMHLNDEHSYMVASIGKQVRKIATAEGWI